MPKKPTPADATLILKLYDLRREAEIRKARNWWFAEFWPETADDFLKVAQAVGTQENNWLRQVPSYWELAASLVLHGTVNETLFLEPAFSGEMFLIFAKLHPFLKDVRERTQNPADAGERREGHQEVEGRPGAVESRRAAPGRPAQAG